MKIQILAIIVLYYIVLILVATPELSLEISQNIDTSEIAINSSEMSDSEIDTGGLFGTGISFTRYLGLVGIGVGFSDIPFWFQIIFSLFQIFVNIVTVSLIISAIWNG